MAEVLLHFARGRAFIADTAYDADRIVAAIGERGMKAVICNSPSRKHNRRRMNRKLYRERYQVEVCFHKLKRLRALATRYEKTARNYLGLVQLACAWLWLN